MKYPYNANETMKLLGQQSMAYVLDRYPEVEEQITEIARARPYSFTLDAACDLFLLGYIYGKRAERARRKGKQNDNEYGI